MSGFTTWAGSAKFSLKSDLYSEHEVLGLYCSNVKENQFDAFCNLSRVAYSVRPASAFD